MCGAGYCGEMDGVVGLGSPEGGLKPGLDAYGVGENRGGDGGGLGRGRDGVGVRGLRSGLGKKRGLV